MTNLEVKYQCGEYTATEVVEVDDDEEYWFDDDILMVGPSGKTAPLCARGLGPAMRLVIFNLCRVEVLP